MDFRSLLQKVEMRKLPAAMDTMPTVSHFQGVRAVSPVGTLTLSALVDQIRANHSPLSGAVTKIRSENDKTARAQLKQELPAVTPSGVFTYRNHRSLQKHSGLTVLDFDGLASEAAAGELRDRLAKVATTAAAFISPSGQGVKVLVRVDPVPKDNSEHHIAWAAAVSRYRALGAPNEDPSGKDVPRLCFLSHDPGAKSQWPCEAVPWKYPEEKAVTEAPAPSPRGDAWIRPALDAIDPVSPDYATWINVGMALHDGESKGALTNGLKLWDSWSRRDTGRYKEEGFGSCADKWKSFRGHGGITLGSLRELARQYGWQDPVQFQPMPSSAPTSQPGAVSPKKSAQISIGREYGTSPAAVARWLLLDFPEEILIINDGAKGDGFFLDAETGIWKRGDHHWSRKILKVSHKLTQKAVKSVRDNRKLWRVLTGTRSLQRSMQAARVRRMLLPVLAHVREHEPHHRQRLQAITECGLRDLDTDTRYMGAANGVIDLQEGCLLPPEEGRKHLVTYRTPVAFDPNATHLDVERLFGHLEPGELTWWWRVLGYHLMGKPSRRFYLVIGETSGGKTTLLDALHRTLGPYADKPKDEALQPERPGNAGLSPVLEAFIIPRRWALFDEVSAFKVSPHVLKRLSGDESALPFRRLHENIRKAPVSATIMMVCNPDPQNLPKLNLYDDAIKSRFRVLPYPKIPNLDPLFKERLTAEDFQQAFLARLVRAASDCRPGVPPEEPATVSEATQVQVKVEIGEIGEFAKRIIRSRTGKITFREVWSAWCRHNEDHPSSTSFGGLRKNDLSKNLLSHVSGFSLPKTIRLKGGKRVHGWRGWRMLTPKDLERREASVLLKNWTPGDTSLLEALIMLDLSRMMNEGTEPVDPGWLMATIQEDIAAGAKLGVEIPPLENGFAKTPAAWVTQRAKVLEAAAADGSRSKQERSALVKLRNRRWPWGEEGTFNTEAFLEDGTSRVESAAKEFMEGTCPVSKDFPGDNRKLEAALEDPALEPGAALAKGLGLPAPLVPVRTNLKRRSQTS